MPPAPSERRHNTNLQSTYRVLKMHSLGLPLYSTTFGLQFLSLVLSAWLSSLPSLGPSTGSLVASILYDIKKL